MIRIIRNIKDFLLYLPLTMVFSPFNKIFIFLYHYNKLIKWVNANKKTIPYSDFYSPGRTHSKRDKYYDYLSDNLGIVDSQICFLEFGVAAGASFNWWLKKNEHPNSCFFGFDTFEGLPESWNGLYTKGDMAYQMPNINDPRALLSKGLFQDTLYPFISQNIPQINNSQKRIIHLDADLYSATAFVLAAMYPLIKNGDIIMFDEFNVATSEFKAYFEFINNYYVTLKPIAAANNFHHVAFEVII